MNFYCGDYDKALGDFEQSSGIMHQNKVLYPQNEWGDDPLDAGASQASS